MTEKTIQDPERKPQSTQASPASTRPEPPKDTDPRARPVDVPPGLPKQKDAPPEPDITKVVDSAIVDLKEIALELTDALKASQDANKAFHVSAASAHISEAVKVLENWHQ